jgi:HlyD family secretion protein
VQQRGNVRLLAPAAGVVTSREAEPGSTVVAGQAVLRLVDPASLWVKTRFDQGRAPGLAVGQVAEVVLRSQVRSPVAGQVARLELLADAVTEERLAQISLDGGVPAGVSVGEMAEVTVQLPSPAPGLVLPNASVQREGGQSGVWRLADGRLQWVAATVVASSLDGAVLLQPAAGQPGVPALAEGDTVVVHSQKALRAGVRVKVVDALVPGAAMSATGAAK